MSRSLSLFAATALVMAVHSVPAQADPLGLGRPATPEEIAAWDLDVSPDGSGLPPGSGSVEVGEELFSDYCAACHGEFAEGIGNWPKLAGGDDTLDRDDPVKTVGSYWPYLSTAWDYVHRSMPFGNAQSLSTDEVYAIVAYILYSNYLVEDDFVLTHENFLDIEMPNADGFIVDDRPEVEYPQFSQPPCMENCKQDVEITMRATILDVTPEETRARQIQQMVDATNPANRQGAAANAGSPASEAGTGAPDPELVAAGERVFKKCMACHQVGDSAKNRTGPVLNGVVGHVAAQVDGFRYSKALEEMGEAGQVWDDATLHAFLEDPKAVVNRTKMSFAGLKKQQDRDAVIAYLRTFE